MDQAKLERLTQDVKQLSTVLEQGQHESVEEVMSQLLGDFYGGAHLQLHHALYELAHGPQVKEEQVQEIDTDLGFVMTQSEEAVIKIMSLLEEVKDRCQQEAELVEKLNQITLLLEFQDLSGQRVKKVRQLMGTLNTALISLILCSDAIRQKDGLVDEIPDYQGDEVKNQGDVDGLLDELGI